MAEKYGSRWVVLYGVVVTALLALTAVTNVTPTTQVLDELTVHRIKIVEPDGKLRMVISNHDAFPGVIASRSWMRTARCSTACFPR